MPTLIFYLIITLVILHFIFNMYADYLNDKARARAIPENVKDVYDQKEYKKWMDYSSEQNRLRFISGLLSFLFVLLMLLNGGFIAIAEWTRTITDSNPYWETLLFLGIIMGIHFIYQLPFKYYFTFSIEERYGFNRSTKKTFIQDQIKALIMTVLLGGGFILLFTLIYQQTGNWFVLVAFIAIMTLFLFINITYTTIFVPLFNKLTPLEDGDLKDSIESFAKKQHYEIKKIHVMDASRRSSKLNAFFSGFGRFKNVVLFDTLLEKMDNDEIVSVLAHEIGHAKHKDVLRNIIFSFVTFAILLSLFFGFISIDIFQTAFAAPATVETLDSIHLGFMLLMFSFVISPMSLLIGLFTNVMSRKAEYKADGFAAAHTNATSMITALKVLTKENFSQLTPHPLYVFLHYSHPPVTDRIKAIDSKL